MATVIVPPYDKSGIPVGPPITATVPVMPPLNTATTRQFAVANNVAGVLQLVAGGDVNLFVGTGDAATAAKPFFQGCIEVPNNQLHTFEFDYDYDFTVRLDGGVLGLPWAIRGVRTSVLATRAIAEVFDRNGVLVGDDWKSPYDNWVIFRSIRRRILGNGKLTVRAQLVNTMTYYWRFTFAAVVNASVRSLRPNDATCECLAMPAVAGGGKNPAPAPGAGAGMKLLKVTINPNVAPFPCP